MNLKAASPETGMEVAWVRRQTVDQMSSQDACWLPVSRVACGDSEVGHCVLSCRLDARCAAALPRRPQSWGNGRMPAGLIQSWRRAKERGHSSGILFSGGLRGTRASLSQKQLLDSAEALLEMASSCLHYKLVETEVQRAEVATWNTLGDTKKESAFGGVLRPWIKLCLVETEGHPDLRHITEESGEI